MNESDLELLSSSPFLTKESQIKKYMSAFVGISKDSTMNKKFNHMKKIIYIHSFYNPYIPGNPFYNPAFNINFLYECDPTMDCEWYEYVLPDEVTRIVKIFFNYLDSHNFLKISLPDNKSYNINKNNNYLLLSTFEASIFDWHIPQNFMPIFCTFAFTMFDSCKKNITYSPDIFFKEMQNKLNNTSTIDYINTEASEPLVTLKDLSTENGTEILRFTINRSQKSFLDFYNTWLSKTFSPDQAPDK